MFQEILEILSYKNLYKTAFQWKCVHKDSVHCSTTIAFLFNKHQLTFLQVVPLTGRTPSTQKSLLQFPYLAFTTMKNHNSKWKQHVNIKEVFKKRTVELQLDRVSYIFSPEKSLLEILVSFLTKTASIQMVHAPIYRKKSTKTCSFYTISIKNIFSHKVP